MEFVKLLLNLITSFFQNSTAKTKKEVTLADAESNSVVQTIRATENAKAVEQQIKAQQAADAAVEKHNKEVKKAEQKSLDEQLDDQFGSDE